jgi:hypothetical protein
MNNLLSTFHSVKVCVIIIHLHFSVYPAGNTGNLEVLGNNYKTQIQTKWFMNNSIMYQSVFIFKWYCKTTFIRGYLIILRFVNDKLVSGNQFSWSSLKFFLHTKLHKKELVSDDGAKFSRSRIKVGLQYLFTYISSFDR